MDKNELEILVKQLIEIIEGKFKENLTDRVLYIDENYIKYVLNWSVDRIDKLSDLLSPEFEFLWSVPDNYSKITENDLQIIKTFTKTYEQNNEEMNREKMNAFLKKYAKENSIKFSKFMKTLRMILSGLEVNFKLI